MDVESQTQFKNVEVALELPKFAGRRGTQNGGLEFRQEHRRGVVREVAGENQVCDLKRRSE